MNLLDVAKDQTQIFQTSNLKNVQQMIVSTLYMNQGAFLNRRILEDLKTLTGHPDPLILPDAGMQ